MKNKAIANDKKETPLKDVLKRERGGGEMQRCENVKTRTSLQAIVVCVCVTAFQRDE